MLTLQSWVLLAVGILLVLVLGKKYWNGGTCHLSPNMEGKVVIVTGSNCGIGYETALRLAQLGATVILACRDAGRGNKALENIKKELKDPHVEFMKLDLSSSNSIKEFVDNFKTKYNRLDILINNAGLVCEQRTLTAEGIEMTFASNHLGHFMLTLLLNDLLIKSAPSRVINVSSKASLRGKMNWDDLMYEKGYQIMRAYRTSKLANVIFSQEYNRRFESKGVKAVSLHPGVVRTEIWRIIHQRVITIVLAAVIYPLLLWGLKSSKQGAQTTLECALIDHDKLVGGAFYKDCVPSHMNPEGRSEEAGKKLWNVSLELLKMKDLK